jgi:hypothetical protein
VSFRIAARVTIVTGLALVALAGCAGEPETANSVATFRVADGSMFKVLITKASDLEIVTALSKGDDAPSIPSGTIVHETGVNTDWSWSLDPTDFGFSDVVDGSCDTTPQEIEDGTFKGDRFCPWSAIVVALEPAP